MKYGFGLLCNTISTFRILPFVAKGNFVADDSFLYTSVQMKSNLKKKSVLCNQYHIK